MKNVELVRLDASIEEALANDPAYMEGLMGGDWTRVAEVVHQHVGRTLTSAPVSVNALEWDGYFVVDADSREVVGSCAYKGPPSEDGTVEIAYFTFPDFAGMGYATSMACKLIDLARDSSAIKRVIAHTLPEASASTRVLEKVAMSFVGEVTDPDDGRVWQWQTQFKA